MDEAALDRQVLRTIRGCNASSPQTIAGILAAFDMHERMLLSCDELSGALARLIGAGLVTEIGRHWFIESSGDGPRTFSGLSAADHAHAHETYRGWIRDAEAAPDDEHEDGAFSTMHLVLRVTTPDGRFPIDEDEDAAEALARRVSPLLEGGTAEVNGFELGTGYVDVLVFGHPTEDDPDELYALLAPAFRAHACPPGSCIVRVDPETGDEVATDVVAA